MSSSLGLIMIIGRSPAASSIAMIRGNTANPTMFCGAIKMKKSSSGCGTSPSIAPLEMNSSASPQSIMSSILATPDNDSGKPWNTPSPMLP
eukprot:30871-Pelagococcus_subviridis.AAC.22